MQKTTRRTFGALAILLATVFLGVNGCDFLADPSALDPNPSTAAILNLTVSGGGRVLIDPLPRADGTYAKGTVVTLTALGGGDFLALNIMESLQGMAGKDFLLSSVFSKWEGDVADSASSITVTLDADKTITATFRRVGVKKIVYPSGTTLYNGGPPLTQTTMVYDDSGRLTESDDWGPAQIARTVYNYDVDGRCSEFDFMSPPPNSSLFAITGVPAITRYQYTSWGAVSEVERYDSKSQMLSYVSYTFNAENKLSSITWFDATLNTTRQRQDISYDTLGRLSLVDIYDSSGGTTLAPFGTVTMNYDMGGSVTTLVMQTTSFNATYTLTYDAATGLISKISLDNPVGDYVMTWQAL
jgi:hypothetical protein